MTPVDGDFQQQYLAAEKAYGAENYEAAQSICERLLGQLELQQKGPEQEAMLAWRAFVALLMGNILLYGMNDIQQAQHHYNLVLDSQPQDTLKELAEQGLKRCQGELQREPADKEEHPQSPNPKQSAKRKPMALKAEVIEPRQSLINDPFLSTKAPNINEANKAKHPQSDQQANQQEIRKLSNELSESLPDLIRDPFLYPAAQTAATEVDYSKSTAKMESTLIAESMKPEQISKQKNYSQQTNLQQKVHAKQEPSATTKAMEIKSDLNTETEIRPTAKSETNPITQVKQDTFKQARAIPTTISEASTNELLNNSLLRVTMPPCAGLSKQETSQLQSKKRTSER
ncbi:hypothetical protein [Prochlorococcus sp. MIT 1201]|uniref:hypothetical protein n=1 Tax=Prochlorococcus sp. MIT 1201 TaxID=3082535 RepID=UPI0039A4E294